jgi:hypothetical protein
MFGGREALLVAAAALVAFAVFAGVMAWRERR